MSTAYQKGATFEYKVKSYLEGLDYTVFRVAGSHSPADLIALAGYQEQSYTKKVIIVWLIQCQHSKYFSKDKKQELQDLANKVNARSVLAWAEDARKRGNLSVRFSDDAIINYAPKPPRAKEK